MIVVRQILRSAAGKKVLKATQRIFEYRHATQCVVVQRAKAIRNDLVLDLETKLLITTVRLLQNIPQIRASIVILQAVFQPFEAMQYPRYFEIRRLLDRLQLACAKAKLTGSSWPPTLSGNHMVNVDLILFSGPASQLPRSQIKHFPC